MSEAKTDDAERVYEATKRRYLYSAVGIAVGLAIAGTLDRSTGGVVLLASWITGIVGLHRLGRAGSVRRD